MLRELHIRNFAVVEALDLEFHHGMTVFTGETGAGKSIIVDVLGMILGDRGDSSMVRDGQTQAEISAVFELTGNIVASKLLEEMAVEPEENELIIRRVIHQEGRSRGYINGMPATVQQLKLLGECLVDLHGQHSHQSLLKSTMQRQILDNFGDLGDGPARVGELHARWRTIRDQLQTLSGSHDDREARLALLRYQVDELEELELAVHEFLEVETRFKQLSHVNQIMETVEAASTGLCTGDNAVLDRCTSHLHALQRAREQDPGLANVIELINNAVIQLEDAGAEFRDYLERLDTDPASVRETEERLNRILDIARKHHVQPEHLHAHAASLRSELDLLTGSAEQHEALLEHERATLAEYRQAAAELSQRRQQAAGKLGREVSKKLHKLGMPAAKFKVVVDYEADKLPAASGLDRVEYLFTANPGQAPKPLSKVASGGELSRVSLAIKVTSTDQLAASSLIFDEVDSGIGGATAEIVGQMLQQLSAASQVFCVTHLAQVAAFAANHLHVSKIAGNNVTRTRVRLLDENSRVEEIARMMGGVKITEQSLAHAREMLNHRDSG